MTYAYIFGGLAAWALGCLAALSLARAAGRECPTPMHDVVETGAALRPRPVGVRKAETAKTA